MDTEEAASQVDGSRFWRDAGLTLVTGASGFVGSHLVEALVEQGARVRVLVRRSSNLRWVRDLPIEFAYGDIRDKASLSGACVGVRNIFHAGGLTKAKSAKDFFQANEAGTRNLGQALAERGEPGGFFIYISSLAAGGPAIETELVREPFRTESDPPTPTTPYGRSKLGGERALAKLSAESGRFRVACLRPPTIYGPRDSAVLLYFRFIKHGLLPLGGPEGARLSMIFVEDLIDGALDAAARGVVGTYYICDGGAYTWNEIGELAGEIMDVSVRPIRIPEPVSFSIAVAGEILGWIIRRPPILSRSKVRDMQQRHWVCSAERAARNWGFRPRFPLPEGLEETLTWYRRNAWL